MRVKGVKFITQVILRKGEKKLGNLHVYTSRDKCMKLETVYRDGSPGDILVDIDDCGDECRYIIKVDTGECLLYDMYDIISEADIENWIDAMVILRDYLYEEFGDKIEIISGIIVEEQY